MKKLHLAITIAVLICGLFVSQVSAAPSPSAVSASSCGKYYTVVGGDTLTKIASLCGTTISDILYFNPAIINANLIYVGQIINLVGTTSTTTTTSGGTTTYSGNAYVTISDTTVDAGDTVVVKAYNFPKNASVDFRVGKKGSSTYKSVYDGTTDSSGYVKKTITIPSGAAQGSTWTVRVLTTDRVNVVSVTSSVITVGSGSNDDDDYSGASVELSKYSVSAGGTITVYVEDFPKNANIDYCVRKKDSSTCKNIYDGSTNSSGDDTMSVTIPAGAASGSYWVVQVKTTDLHNVTKVVSSKITIK